VVLSFSDLKIVLVDAVGESAEVAILYGMFIENIIDFLIIALCIFAIIKILSSVKKKEVEKPAPAPIVDPVVELLSEIRDELRKNS
jgi:large conductance mechanosensitive channel